MAASSPLHNDGSASRQPSSHSLHGITLHRTPPFQATKSKALLVLSGRGAAVALVALSRDLDPSNLRAPHALMLGPRRVCAQEPCAHTHVLGLFCQATSADHHAANGRDTELNRHARREAWKAIGLADPLPAPRRAPAAFAARSVVHDKNEGHQGQGQAQGQGLRFRGLL
jgi:hypothetical protein